MGATAFRTKKTARGQYKRRKEERRSGKAPADRSHESVPWYVHPHHSVSAYEHALDAERLRNIARARDDERRAEARAFEAMRIEEKERAARERKRVREDVLRVG